MLYINETKSSAKFDCAKECPCGMPTIPVPDQWLEVMVTGGFKVWHIIFIIIAFVVTMTVVYCCFHRCRIPRTKQEIEADLMRSNLTTKFGDYLQELPNEPTTFVEALKKVQEIEEKLEQEDAQLSRDAGARKRLGWLKIRGKGDNSNKENIAAPSDAGEMVVKPEPANGALELANGGEPAKVGSEIKQNPMLISSQQQPAGEQLMKEPAEPERAKGEISGMSTVEPNWPADGSERMDQQKERNVAAQRQARRRRQKPNLARTKLGARERLPPEPDGDHQPHSHHHHHHHQEQAQQPQQQPQEHPKQVVVEKPASPAAANQAENGKPPGKPRHHSHRLKTGHKRRVNSNELGYPKQKSQLDVELKAKLKKPENNWAVAMKDEKVRMIELLRIAAVFLVLAICLQSEPQFVDADESQDAERLPMIWPCIGRDKSYHLMFQLQILDSTERLIIEEWASFESEQFRLDLISNDHRISYLMDGKTGKVFTYHPFTCAELKSDSNDLGVLQKLFKGYKMDNSTGEIAYGLGPLWLRAQAEGKCSRVGESKRRSALTPNYVIYQVEFNGGPGEDVLPYRLKFHFKLEHYQFVDMVEWLDDSKPVDGADSGKEPEIMARAKVIVVDVNSRISSSIFELPVGYGCTSEDRLHPLPGFAGNSLPSYHQFGQGVFELTLSKPRDDQFQAWDSQKYTVQALYGGLKLNEINRDFNAISVQWRDPDTAQLRRTKFVWSVVNRYEKDARSRQANIYIIDQDSNQCQMVHDYYRDFVMLTFPGQKNSQASPVTLSLDSISDLFAMDSGFYLIRENSLDGLGQLRESWHERRIENYTELAADGSIIWSGPISVVNKMVSYYQLPLDHSSGEKRTKDFVHRFHETITVFFYSDDYTKILYKLVGEFDDSAEADLRAIQRQMDIGVCLEANRQEDIVIKYPIESQEANKNLRPLKNMVEDLFCMNLFGTTPIQPLQVANIEASFDTFFMYITLTLLDLPASQSYELTRGHRLIEGSDKSGLIEKRSRDADSCAQSCDHYTCFRFSFDRSTRRCRLEVRQNSAVIGVQSSSDLYELIKLEFDPDSAWSRLLGSSSARAHLRPQELVDMLDAFVAFNESLPTEQKHQRFDDTVGEIPLVLRLPTELLIGAHESQIFANHTITEQNLIWTELRPISVQANVESMSELIRESDSVVRVVLDATTRSHLQIEYTLLVQGREFRESAYKLVETTDSYEECAQLCQASDCRSFSYCEHNHQCKTSELQRDRSIQLATYYEPRCEVYALDYLSKFEDFGQVVAPVMGIKKSLELADERECALACMEEANFNCQAFYHCQKAGGKRDCLLSDNHINSQPRLDRTRLRFVSEIAPNNVALIKNKCKFYSRSYLAQFDRYLGRMFELPDELAESTTMIDDQDAEGCAQLCIENSCLAFDVCLEPRANSAPRQVCQFVNQEVRKAHLRAQSRCTTYVLSDRSQFNFDKKSLIFGERSDREALAKPIEGVKDVDLVDRNNQSSDEFSKLMEKFENRKGTLDERGSSSSLLAKFISLCFGALLGVGCVFTWQQRDTIYLIVTRFTSRNVR